MDDRLLLGIGTVAALGAGFLIVNKQGYKYPLNAETFMAEARAVRKDTIYYPLVEDGHAIAGKANPSMSYDEQVKGRLNRYGFGSSMEDFRKPVVKQIIQKLKRAGQIPNFTAHPGYPSYEEWLLEGGSKRMGPMRNQNLWASWIHPPLMNQYQPDFIASPYSNKQVMRTPVPKPADWTWWDNIIGNKLGQKTATNTKWRHFNWKYAAKQREQYRKDLAGGMYGPNGSDYLDWGQNVFDLLKWYVPLNLKRWMELNPDIKAISHKHARYGWKDFKFWRNLPSHWPINQMDGKPYPTYTHRRTQYYLLPDKKDRDKEAKEALDYFLILWVNGYNAQLLKDYTEEVQAAVKTQMEQDAFWANLDVTGELKSHITEKMEDGRIIVIPPAYHTVAQQAWNEYEGRELSKHQERMNTIRKQWNF